MSLPRTACLAATVVLCALPAPGQLSFFSELQGAGYPNTSAGREARQADLRGWGQVEYKRTIPGGLRFRGDLTAYGPDRRSALIDGTAELVWRGRRIEIAGGLLRDRLGRFNNSYLDTLGPANTVFSLLRPETRLSQPGVRATAFLRGLSIDLYVLAGGRLQPLPDSDRRFSLGAPSRNIVQHGGMGDTATAVRVSGTKGDIDWSTHVFAGRNRRPTFVPGFTGTGALMSIDAIYTEIRQFGGEIETTVADWRLLGEGFVRQGAVNVQGQKQTYGHISTALEYQRFGAFGRNYDLIPRVEFLADTRRDKADLPFASSVRAGARLAQTGLLPVQIEAAYAFDWVVRGHGVIASVEKVVGESPTLRLGCRFTSFSDSVKPSLLNLWKRDFEASVYLRLEVSGK